MRENLSTKLKNRVEVWGKADERNSLGEDDVCDKLLAVLWCDIVPRNGKVEDIPHAASQYEAITHEVTFRRTSARYLSAENYIKSGTDRLEIEYVMPHYNDPDRIIAYCRQAVNL
ncbi:MAG: hypothetical protein HFE63_01000 [Clostridiales bacterium]|nr:hypothetical protein [Clostridiales bacterium]